MSERFTLPPVITGSSWSTVLESLWSQSRRDDDAASSPTWTNREAVAVVAGLRELGRGAAGGFPLWYQFAAVAYAWEPGRASLDATERQADELYPAEQAAQLAGELKRVVGDLESKRHPEPRFAIADVFDRAAFQAEVAGALAQDGADAQFKIPLPACKDPRTGRPTRPVKDPQTGKWSCPGGVVTVDDPITAIVKSLSKLAVPIAIALVAYGALYERTRRGRRKRRY